jgi:hypothetical protein
LSTEDAKIIDDFSTYYDSNVSELNILLHQDIVASNIDVYNLVGHKITSYEITSRENTIPIKIDKGVYIIKLHTENGISTKKILIK